MKRTNYMTEICCLKICNITALEKLNMFRPYFVNKLSLLFTSFNEHISHLVLVFLLLTLNIEPLGLLYQFVCVEISRSCRYDEMSQ